jgi:Uma2 family endonuclease
MAQEITAPWGEIMPGVGSMTADELLALGDKGRWCELVDGVLVKMSPTGYMHGRIVGNLTGELAHYVKTHHLGAVFGAETGFLLSPPAQKDTVLGADVAFVRAERTPPPDAPDLEKYQRLAPDLVVEVASPNQRASDVAKKVRVYLDAGVRLVWVIWPGSKMADVWRPGSDTPSVTLTVADRLDGLDVVPGFSYPLADLFQ